MPNFKSLHFCLGLMLLFGCQFFVTTQTLAQKDSPQQDQFQRRRAYVIEFVHENHPKMEELLLAIEESHPSKFRSAVKRISKTLSRMKVFEKRHPKRYVALVELWKVKSEIELLTARLANQDDPELRKQMDALIEVFIDNRRQVLEFSKRHIEQRLERADRLLEMIETDRDAFVKKQMRSVDRTIKQIKSGRPGKK